MAITDLLGGQIEMMITDTATGLPHIKAASCAPWAIRARRARRWRRRCRPSTKPGVKGYDMGYWFAAYAPAKTPQPVVDQAQ